MKRRAFLQKLGIGLVATAALAHVPASVIKCSEWLASAGKDWAIERLYKAWHTFHARNSRVPKMLRVSPYMLAMYESELQACERFVRMDVEPGVKILAFKGAWVVSHGKNVDYIEVM